MKKIVSLIIAAILLAGTIGCSDKDKDNNKTTTSSATAETADGVDITSTLTAGDESATVTTVSGDTGDTAAVTEQATEQGLSVYTENFVNGECSVTLLYPRYGDGEHELFDISMRNFAMQKYNGSGMMPEDSAVYEVTLCDIKYESEYFVSAVVAGHIINTTSVSDSYFSYTVNADPRSGRIYLSEELIGDLDVLKTAMHEGMFEQTFGMDGLMQEITYDVITQSWRSDYGVFPSMYFTQSTFGVVPELPHVVGGYAGFEIPYADAGDMMNPTAKGLVGLIVTTD